MVYQKGKKERQKPGKTGPEPERVKIEKQWDEAVKDALKKKRPKGGWPDEKKPSVDK